MGRAPVQQLECRLNEPPRVGRPAKRVMLPIHKRRARQPLNENQPVVPGRPARGSPLGGVVVPAPRISQAPRRLVVAKLPWTVKRIPERNRGPSISQALSRDKQESREFRANRRGHEQSGLSCNTGKAFRCYISLQGWFVLIRSPIQWY